MEVSEKTDGLVHGTCSGHNLFPEEILETGDELTEAEMRAFMRGGLDAK